MRKQLLGLGLLALILSAGCGGGSSATTPDPADDTTDRQSAVSLSSDVASADIASDIAMAPMAGELRERPGLNDLDSCTVVEGTRDTAGSITYNNCETPRGTLNGVMSWLVDVNTRTTHSDLTFTRTADSIARHMVGDATWTRVINADNSRSIHRVGDSTTTSGTTRVENESDLTFTMTRTPSFIERTYPVGTITTRIFESDVLTKTVVLTFDGTSTVSADVDGVIYTYDISQRQGPRPRFHGRRPGGRPGPR